MRKPIRNGEIRTVVFDIGGVLVQNPAQALLENSAKAWGVEVDEFKIPYLKHFHGYERGHFDASELYRKILADLHLINRFEPHKAKGLWLKVCHEVFERKFDTLQIVSKLRSLNYQLALLSNTEPQTTELFREWGFEQLFPTQIYSCFESCAKPESSIYHLTQKRTKSFGSSILFIDDKWENIQAAQKFNWHCIHYQNELQFHHEIKQYIQELR